MLQIQADSDAPLAQRNHPAVFDYSSCTSVWKGSFRSNRVNVDPAGRRRGYLTEEWCNAMRQELAGQNVRKPDATRKRGDSLFL